MQFRYSGLAVTPFQPLFAMSDAELAMRGISRVTADAKPGFPCRITLEDAEPGESLLLLPFEHQPAHSPYKSSGPIFVRERANQSYDGSEFPPVFRGRLLSIRAYDGAGIMVDADLAEGDLAESVFTRMFERDDAVYLHVHNARRGCYAARVDRA
jgi:hypothetical protein